MSKVITSIFSTFLQSPLPSSVTVSESPRVSLPAGKFISLEEVSWHDNCKDCWIIIYDRVYDVTDFLDEHPGGGDILLEYAGGEASGAFRGSGHSAEAIRLLKKYCIGYIPTHECIFRKPGGFTISDLPE